MSFAIYEIGSVPALYKAAVLSTDGARKQVCRAVVLLFNPIPFQELRKGLVDSVGRRVKIETKDVKTLKVLAEVFSPLDENQYIRIYNATTLASETRKVLLDRVKNSKLNFKDLPADDKLSDVETGAIWWVAWGSTEEYLSEEQDDIQAKLLKECWEQVNKTPKCYCVGYNQGKNVGNLSKAENMNKIIDFSPREITVCIEKKGNYLHPVLLGPGPKQMRQADKITNGLRIHL